MAQLRLFFGSTSGASSISGSITQTQELQLQIADGNQTFGGAATQAQEPQNQTGDGELGAPSQDQSHGGPGLVIRDRWKRAKKQRPTAPILIGTIAQSQAPQIQIGEGWVQQVLQGRSVQFTPISRQRSAAAVSYEARNEREFIELLKLIA